jgi:hypothetical protein
MVDKWCCDVLPKEARNLEPVKNPNKMQIPRAEESALGMTSLGAFQQAARETSRPGSSSSRHCEMKLTRK